MLIKSKSNQELIEKALTSSQLQGGGGGYMSTAQATAFIRQVFDATVLFPIVRRIVMPKPEMEINKIFVGERIMRAVGSENEDQQPFARNATFETLTLVTKKFSLSWEISEDALEDSIEKGALEATLSAHFSTRMGLDLEDLALNGAVLTPTATVLDEGAPLADTDDAITVNDSSTFPSDSDAGYLLIGDATMVGAYELVSYGLNTVATNTFSNCIRSSGPNETNPTAPATWADATAVSWYPHPLIGTQNGWLRIAETGGANMLDASTLTGGGDLDKFVFFEMERRMPTQYIRGAAKSSLRWICSYRQYINWQEYLANQNANRGYDVLAGTEFWPLGIPMITANSMTDKKMMLTFPRNLIVGIWRQLRVRRAVDDFRAVSRDLRFYNAKVRSTQEVERRDAVVIAYNMTGSAGA